jgi:DNA-binding IclR family transcriptional regulator
VLVAYVHLLAGRMAVVHEYRKRGAKTITVTDTIVSLAIYTWGEHGTRPQHLIDSLGIPRRTLRDSLRRLHHYGVVYREEDGLYFPSQLMGDVASVFWDRHRRDIHRLCDAMREYARD